MKSEKLLIDGMSCQHCVISLRKELSKLDLTIIDIQIGSAEVEYDNKKISYIQLEDAVKDAGFVIKKHPNIPLSK